MRLAAGPGYGSCSQTILVSDGHDATLAGSAYRRLLDDIIWGRLEPGRKLRIHELKSQYGLGHSPLREALNRLSECGLVVREENRGFRVSPTSAEELAELTRMRCWLEEIGLRQSMRYGDSRWEEQIVVAHHWLAKTDRSRSAAPGETTLEWERRHREFHLALISACRAPKLIHFCSLLQDQTLRYRNLAAMKAYRDEHEPEEHEGLMDAVLARDADRAVALLCTHYGATRKIVSAALQYPIESEPDAAGGDVSPPASDGLDALFEIGVKVE